MYKSFTADEYRKHFNLPPDYSVKGFMSYGAWDEENQFVRLKKVLGELGIAYAARRLEGFLSSIFELTVNQEIYWFTVMYGGAQLSEYAHQASLFGSKRNLHIGSCGGLYSEMDSLDFLIPSWSHGNESSTRAYELSAVDFKHYPDGVLSASLRLKVKEGSRIWSGPVVSNQAMMGESLEDVRSWSENGFYGVEMETATVFAVSNHFKVPSAALLYVSDNLIKGQTVNDENHVKQKENREEVKDEVYRIGLRTLFEE